MSEPTVHKESPNPRDILIKALPYMLMLVGFGLPYIWLTHQTENTIRRIEKLKKEIKDNRSEYITLKSELMTESTESKVAERLAQRGVKSLDKAPYRLKLSEQ